MRRLSFEHHDQTLAIIETLGEVIGIDTSNDLAKDPHFCMNLMVTKGWIISIDLKTYDGMLLIQKILVYYDNLPMKCKTCHSWKHRVRNCKEIKKLTVIGRGDQHTHTTSKCQTKAKTSRQTRTTFNKSDIEKTPEETHSIL